jgi:hypothetical protein
MREFLSQLDTAGKIIATATSIASRAAPENKMHDGFTSVRVS